MSTFHLPTSTPSRTQLIAFTVVTGLLLLGTALWTQSRLGDRLLPHAFCISASQPLLLLHLVSDGLIAFAYLLIPWTIMNFVRKRKDVPFGWVAWLFCAFIIACAITHATEMWTLWYPVYWYAGVAKAFTAAVSLGTAWVFYMLTPHALALPSTGQLQAANVALQREIASRRQAEAELQQAKTQLEMLLSRSTTETQRVSAVLDGFFQAAPTGLSLLDHDGVFMRVNPAMSRLTGYDHEEYVGTRARNLPRLPPQVLESIEHATSTGRHRTNFDVSRTEPDGETVHWLCNFFPIRIDNGPAMCGCIIQDVTRERRLEQQRAEALATAEEANRAKDEFLAKVSHELRTPLQIALSSAEVLKRVPDLPEQGRKFVDRLSHAISMQARMINDLLDLSRILSGKLHIANEAIDPATPFLRVVDHWSQTAQAAGVQLDATEVHAGDAIVEADPARLEQVYTNLLDNAIRFSPEGSTVKVSGRIGEGAWRFTVQDTGVGMTADELQTIFRPFAQGSTQPRSGKGLGLGLAIVKSLVEAFGGGVSVHSGGPGQGSTFVIELPVSGMSPFTPPARDERMPAPRLDGLCLLYVEDEPDVAAAMRDGLVQLGARVNIATNYAEGLARLEQLELDVLVTDLNLGEGPGGRELAVAAHAMRQHARLPVIAVSAFGGVDHVEATRQAGISAHLVKPVTVNAVAQAIRTALPPHER